MNRFDRRLTRLEEALCVDPAEEWRYTKGISSLLTGARSLPQRDPWDLPELESTSMGRMLVEARRAIAARQEEQRHG
jgi:hypothetical protein